VTGKGAPVTYVGTQFHDERDALLFAIDTVNKTYAAKLRSSGTKITPRDEPAWQDRSIFLRIVRGLGLSNEPAITAAIGVSAQTLANLPVIRNFYAHRTEDTAKKTAAVQLRYGFSGSIHPTEFLASRVGTQPHAILRYLVEDISISITTACF
jgi:hypothetical protein